MGVILPSSYVVAAEATSRNTFSLIFTLGTLGVIVIGLVLSQNIARPILKLRNFTQEVAAGNLEGQMDLDRSDEIGELADAFDGMTLRLRERTREAERLYAEAVQRNRELVETNQQLRTTQMQLVQSEKLAAVGQLTAGIVHDVKNPLTVIKGMAELMLTEGEIPAEVVDEITLIRDSALKANTILSDLLTFARQSTPELTERDMRETVEAALRLTAFPLRKAHVQVTKQLPGEPVMMVYDNQQIEQVLVNLITNAVQAMPEGGELHVRLAQAGDMVSIAVQDTGTGIPAEYLNRIFDPFFTTKPEGEGTGLGLSVGYGIITNHNGRIEVQSTPGKGTTFTIWLPAGHRGEGVS
jgi:two-component system NtrC family sensor kinase